jgi:hypothetical protein
MLCVPSTQPNLYEHDMRVRSADLHPSMSRDKCPFVATKCRKGCSRRGTFNACSPCLKERKIDTPRGSGYNPRRTRHEGTTEGKFTYSCFGFQESRHQYGFHVRCRWRWHGQGQDRRGRRTRGSRRTQEESFVRKCRRGWLHCWRAREPQGRAAAMAVRRDHHAPFVTVLVRTVAVLYHIFACSLCL